MENLSQKITEMMTPQNADESLSGVDSTSRAIVQELKDKYYENKDLLDFSEFRDIGKYPSSGKYPFALDLSYLQYACGVLKNIVSSGTTLNKNVKVVIFKNQLKISGFNSEGFAEVLIPLSTNTCFDKNYFFVIELSHFQKLVASFEKRVINFCYVPEKYLLQVVSGQTQVDLPTEPEVSFTEYSKSIKEIKDLEKQVNPQILKTALSYMSLCSSTETSQNDNPFGIVECRDGALVGGNGSYLGLFKSDLFVNNPLKIRHESISTINKILPYFSSKTRLFLTENYYLFRDQNVFFGISIPSLKFPSLKNLLSEDPVDSYTVLRETLLKSLIKISVASLDRNNLVKLTVTPTGSSTTLLLELKEGVRASSKDVINISRSRPDTSIREYHISLEKMIDLLKFVKTSEVKVFELNGKSNALMVKCEDNEYTTTSIISVGHPVK
ncbi:MAG: hypothetical protein WC511_02805 [Candidatus Pacearchaeota archaeon]